MSQKISEMNKIPALAGDTPIPTGADDVGVGNFATDPDQLAAFIILDEDDFTSDSATKAPSQQSTKAYVDGKTPFIWYQNTIDNSGGGTVLSTNSDKDIFQQFPVNFPNDGYFVTALVKIKAAAVQAGDEGNGYYSAEKIFTFYRDYAPEVSKKGEGVAVYEIGDDDLDIDMSADDGNVRLTIDTPAGDTYAWTVIAEITYSSIFYEV